MMIAKLGGGGMGSIRRMPRPSSPTYKARSQGSEMGSKYAETGWLGNALVLRSRNQLLPLTV